LTGVGFTTGTLPEVGGAAIVEARVARGRAGIERAAEPARQEREAAHAKRRQRRAAQRRARRE